MEQKLSFTGERLVPDALNASVMIEHLHRYAMATSYCKGKTVLDIASGEGYGSNILSTVAEKVTGVDIDAGVIGYAKKKYIKNNLSFKVGSASEIPMETASVDVVVSFETIEHHDKHDEMIAEVKRVLKPGGLLIISTPDKKYYSDIPRYANPFHVKELYQHEFDALLKKYFRNVQMTAQQSGLLSVLYPVGVNGIDGEWLSKGTTAGIEIVQSSQPLYLIALASDGDFTYNALSFFKDNNLVENINSQMINAIYQSKTYRAGKLVLSPLAWLRGLLGKKA